MQFLKINGATPVKMVAAQRKKNKATKQGGEISVAPLKTLQKNIDTTKSVSVAFLMETSL